MVLISGFTSTTVWKAFFLNALATSIAISIALIIKTKFERYVDIHGNRITNNTSLQNIVLGFMVTFIATFFTFISLHIIFGFGGGMLAN